VHWGKIVKNIGCANQNIEGQKDVKSDGRLSIIGGTCPGCPPKSKPMHMWSLRAQNPYSDEDINSIIVAAILGV